tara:strand:+ start:1377 stop:1589 length:213 start_codon:yes stop_codon:yes gene_type:complete
MSIPLKRSVVISGHQTSVSLEKPFWEALNQIATDRNLSINRLISEIDHERESNLSSALRVYVLNTLKNNG